MSSTFTKAWSFRRIVIPACSILAFLPIIYSLDDETMPRPARKCLYILCVMAVCWVTEATPIAVTALFPVVMFPLAGVMTAKVTAGAYISDTSMLFLGGLIVAVAVEECHLHKRIAVGVMLLVGSDPKWVMAGLMIPTWFLSMWISNTATASMMVPIAAAVLDQMKPERRGPASAPRNGQPMHPVGGVEGHVNQGFEEDGVKAHNGTTEASDITLEISDSEIQWTEGTDDPNYARKCKGMLLCIAYAANFGGIATLTGTPPNLVLRDAADELYNEYQLPGQPKDGSPISFANWMGMAIPLSVITLVLGWSLLVIFFLSGRGCCTTNSAQAAGIKRVIREEYKKLGGMTFSEVMMIVLFVTLAVMWLSRDPKEADGWAKWFHTGFVSDGTSAMLIAVLLFILPSKVPYFPCCSKTSPGVNEPYYKPLLTWNKVHQKVPWGVFLLLGGGFSLAKGVKESGLDRWMAEELRSLDWMDTRMIVLVLCCIVAAFTEITSNTATAQILMPILGQLAISLQVNPLRFMVPTCLATSVAFMLPVATPPNAIVFSFGNIRVIDMTMVGFFMNIIGVGCLTLCANTWAHGIYDFGDLDARFQTNSTAGL